MSAAYAGPFRDEPLAVELYNTIYADGGARVDAFDDPGQAAAWVRRLGARLPAGLPTGGSPSVGDLRSLREAVRVTLGAVADGRAPTRSALAVLNAVAAAAPLAPRAVAGPGGTVRATVTWGSASRAEAVLALLAADAIALVAADAGRAGHGGVALHRCGAPGCVLLYVRDHPRRSWCSNACGNRARQARHYARAHPR